MSAFGTTATRSFTGTSTQVRRQGTNARIQEATRLERRAQKRDRIVAGAKSASLRLLLASVAAVAAAAGGFGLWKLASDARWSGLRAIEIRGASRLGAGVAQESGLSFGAGLVAQDLDAARARLLADPWILDAKLSRRWPHRVVIRVVERVPVAEISAHRWISLDGVVLPPRGEGRFPRFVAKGFAHGRIPRNVAIPVLEAVRSMEADGVTDFGRIAALRDGGMELVDATGGPSVLVVPSDWRKGLARRAALRNELGEAIVQFSELDLRHGPCAALRRAQGGV